MIQAMQCNLKAIPARGRTLAFLMPPLKKDTIKNDYPSVIMTQKPRSVGGNRFCFHVRDGQPRAMMRPLRNERYGRCHQ